MNKKIASSHLNGVSIASATRLVTLAMALLGMLCATSARAQELILDNSGAVYNTLGTWKSSTAVAGYFGTNYDTRFPGPSPDALVVDNQDAGFSTLGEWKTSTAISGYLGSNYQHHFANGAPPSTAIADNTQGTPTGTWSSSTSVSGFYASNYQFAAAGSGANTFSWALPIASSGNFDVYARWTAHPNRASNAAYTINHSGGSTVATVNQQANGAQWVLLGSFAFDPAQSPSISLSDAANGYVIADAVMAVPEGAPPNTATWALNVATAGSYDVYARWTAHPNRATNAAYTVNHSGGSTVATVNQQANGGQWNLLGSFVLDPGQNPSVSLTDQADGYVIADAIMVVAADAVPNSAVWSVPPGTYEVYARWSAHPNRATNAPYTVNHIAGSALFAANQQLSGGQWNLLGSFTFDAGGNVTLTDEADGYVVADAIRLVSLAPAPAQTYYIDADHLNTPRVITDVNQTVVWRWDNEDPFGATVASEDADGNGNIVTCNLRFPGQYFDRETNNHYNYFRNYSPETGRYVESDPIGLRGGLNTYGYVSGNPLYLDDPFGLDPMIVFGPSRNGGVYDSPIIVVNDLGEIVFLGDGSTLPNRPLFENTVAPGEYPGVNTFMATPDESGNRRPGIWLPGKLPTTPESPSTTATDVFVHCGYSESNTGSDACFTIKPDQCSEFFDLFNLDQNVTVIKR